jgi:CDGSH-type Zn-finger protein
MTDAIRASNGPYPLQVEAGQRYSWCSCGRSKTQPLCDHSHRGTTELRSVKFTPTESGTVLLCGCKATKNPPYCDGSHNAT